MKFDSDFHVSLRMNDNNLDFSSGQHFNSSNTLVYDDEISAKVMTSHRPQLYSCLLLISKWSRASYGV